MERPSFVFTMVRGVLVIVLVTLVALPQVTAAKTLEELREELDAKRDALKQAEENIGKFKEEIQVKRSQARTLSEQINIIDENIEEVELTLGRTALQIEEVELEIETVEQEITEREAEIGHQKDRLADYLRQMHELDQQSTVTIFLKYNTFAEAVQEVSTFEQLQRRGQETLVSIQSLRDDLLVKHRELEDYNQSLTALKNQQEQEQATLETQKGSKARILDLTNQQEAEYQDLLKAAQSTHQQAQADISRLDTLIREELKRRGFESLPSVGILDWPITPSYGVSCEFHCSGYPYAYLIGPHSGMDIPANIGTPIRAPADGYVARVHDSGGPGYSYILLLHGDNVSTVYGHVSGFAVNEDQLVTRGTVIGYTGGAPGMRGAGLSTGPHLHFEVRVNNVPTNPRQYL